MLFDRGEGEGDDRTDSAAFVAEMGARAAAGEDPLAHVPESMQQQISAALEWGDE